jgi:H+/Cl- antiporter ClcA
MMILLISQVIAARNNTLQSMTDSGSDQQKSLVFFALYNLCLATLGALVTAYLEPTAAADGIAELKAYLNGSHARNVFGLRAVIVRFFGTVASVGSGLVCGPEGNRQTLNTLNPPKTLNPLF